jgi:hypothetical protein
MTACRQFLSERAIIMAITHRTTGKAAQKGQPQAMDAIALLRADHEEVEHLFEEFESAQSSAEKQELITQICNELTVHAQIEEEIFYPAIRQVLKGDEDKELVPEALVEHSAVKSLIAEAEGLEPEDDMLDARIKVMCEYVKHHIKEEQEKIFPKAQAARQLDMMELGRQLSQRKAELMAAVSA